eukprot:1184336-Amphidinium_carterae.1
MGRSSQWLWLDVLLVRVSISCCKPAAHTETSRRTHPSSVESCVRVSEGCKDCAAIHIWMPSCNDGSLLHYNNATHSKLVEWNAKVSNAIVLKPTLGKLVARSSFPFNFRICESQPKSKTE